MPSFDSAPQHIREFSLAELVAKITELEKRQQARPEGIGERARRESDGRSEELAAGREDASDSEQALTE